MTNKLPDYRNADLALFPLSTLLFSLLSRRHSPTMGLGVLEDTKLAQVPGESAYELVKRVANILLSRHIRYLRAGPHRE